MIGNGGVVASRITEPTAGQCELLSVPAGTACLLTALPAAAVFGGLLPAASTPDLTMLRACTHIMICVNIIIQVIIFEHAVTRAPAISGHSAKTNPMGEALRHSTTAVRKPTPNLYGAYRQSVVLKHEHFELNWLCGCAAGTLRRSRTCTMSMQTAVGEICLPQFGGPCPLCTHLATS